MRPLAVHAARLAGVVSRRLGRGGGTTVPGVVLLRLAPGSVRREAARLPRGSICVSATNGKTTTARLLRSAIDAAGWEVVANTSGSNLLRGVAAALTDRTARSEVGLFEVDEAALPSVVTEVRPRAVVLMNLFRDQLDRYGELEVLVDRWRAMLATLPTDTTVVVNADDPSLAYLPDPARHRIVRFGVDAADVDRGALSHASDSTHCPVCNAGLTYDLVTIGHLGHWRCPACRLARPHPEFSVSAVAAAGIDGSRATMLTPQGPAELTLALPGLHNVYNGAAALAGAVAMGLGVVPVAAAMADTRAAFGRGEQLTVEGRAVVLLLAKNPTGANENVRTVLTDEGPVHLLLLLNDRTADGRDVSWIWDVDYEPAFDRIASLTLGGDRAYDLGLRFRYGGLDAALVSIEESIPAAFDRAVRACPSGSRLYVMPTYTAMLELRAELNRRGLTNAFWEDQ